MSKLVIWNLVSLDGYFEGTTPWDLEFHHKAWGPELEALSIELVERAAALVFGRRTYEGMAEYWATAEPGELTTFMNELPKLVASRTLESVDWNNARLADDIVAELVALKATSEKDIYLLGSSDLMNSLLRQGVVDELILCVVPTLLGRGSRLFKDVGNIDFPLRDSRQLANGSMVLRYAT